VGIKIPCPHCGPRDYTEFAFGGELRPIEAADVDDDFRRVYLRDNAPGDQHERWFHTLGCRRWVTLVRDTVTNRIDAQIDGRRAGQIREERR
jgi:heterotetrameric sarcosine oxidase delta subunit